MTTEVSGCQDRWPFTDEPGPLSFLLVAFNWLQYNWIPGRLQRVAGALPLPFFASRQVLVCSLGWPGTQYSDKVGLELSPSLPQPPAC